MLTLPDPSVRRALRLTEPRTPRELHGYIRGVLGFHLPRSPIVTGHAAPFAYIKHAFFETGEASDCVVWANRGGGKTQLGAIATLLDMLFKPGIQVRILGGSFEQSSKMYRYLKHLLEDDVFSDLIAGNLTGRFVELTNGSRVEVLSQSERAVRGQRVQKLRCDEVELFDTDVWDAAQMVTRSEKCGNHFVHGSIETLSTMHRPFGLMQRIVRDAQDAKRRIFRWSVLDVLEHCPLERACETCPLWDDCGGRAKDAHGFIAIDDAIQQQRRVGEATWRAEMLCEKPSRSSNVYPEFDPDVHVCEFEPPNDRRVMWLGGMDFGYRDPTVMLWAFIDRADDPMDATLHIVDEYVSQEQLIEQHLRAAEAKPWPRPTWIGADPAGHQRNEQTGRSVIQCWKRAGWPMRTRVLQIEPGIAAVRRRLRRADGTSGLVIHPRCETLIKAMMMYHYPPNEPESSTPVKDGHDHAADALRYLVTSLDGPAHGAQVARYC